MTRTRTAGGRPAWPVPAGLLLLSAIPLSAGTLRLVSVSGGPDLLPPDDRWTGFPAALVLHIGTAAILAVGGAFQFVAGIRRRHPGWHRRAGRVLVAAGLLVATSALWLTLFHPAQPGTGRLLFVLRLVVATAMIAFLAMGFAAIRRRDVRAHRAWMIRAYALGLGAGTQAFTEGLTEAVAGTGVFSGDLAKGAGWLINLAVAEWVIRRDTLRTTAPRVAT